MDTVYKTFRGEVKGVDKDEGTIDMLIPVSSMSVDRDGEVIEPLAFKKTIPKFMKHPVLVSSHDYKDLTKQIGEWQKLKVVENGVDGKPKYYVNEGNQEADWAFKLASKGRAAFSVGFIPKVWDDGDGEKTPIRTYKEVELLEISQVIIPSNRDAIQSIRSKAADPVILELCDEVEKEIEPEETLAETNVEIPDDDIEEKEISVEEVLKPYPQEHACRLRDPGGFQEGSFRRTTRDHEGKKYSVIMGKLKDDTAMTEQAYRYDKDVWDASAAKAHCKDHDGTFEAAAPERASQAQILDEIDYLAKLIHKSGMNDDVEMALLELTGEESEFKQGAVLNQKNRSRLNQIKSLAQDILDSAGEPEEERTIESEEEQGEIIRKLQRLPESDNSVEENNNQEILDEILNTKLK